MATTPSIPISNSLMSSSLLNTANNVSNLPKSHHSKLPPPLVSHLHQVLSTTNFAPSLAFPSELCSILRNSLITFELVTLSPIKVTFISHPLHRDISASHVFHLAQSFLQYGYENSLPSIHGDPFIAIRYNQSTEITRPYRLGQPTSSYVLVPEIDDSPVYYVIAGADRVEAIEYALRTAPNNDNLVRLLQGKLKNHNGTFPTLNNNSRRDVTLSSHTSNDRQDELNGGINFYVLDGSKLSVDQVTYLSTHLDYISHQITFGIQDLREIGTLPLSFDDSILKYSNNSVSEYIMNSDSSALYFFRVASSTRHEDFIQQLDRIISQVQKLLSENLYDEVTVDMLVHNISPPFYILEKSNSILATSLSSTSPPDNSIYWLIWLVDVFCPYIRNGTQFDENQHKFAIPGFLFPNFATQIRSIIYDHILFEKLSKLHPDIIGEAFFHLIATCNYTLRSILKPPDYGNLWNNASFFDLYSVDTINHCENWKSMNIIPLLRLNNNQLSSEDVTNIWSSLSNLSPEEVIIQLFKYPSLQGIFHIIGATSVAFFYALLNHQDELVTSSASLKEFAAHAPIFISKLSELGFKCCASSINLVQCNENHRLRILEALSLIFRFAIRGGGRSSSLITRRWPPFPSPVWTSACTSFNSFSLFPPHKDEWITLSTWDDIEDYIYNQLLLNIIITPPHLLLSPAKEKPAPFPKHFFRWLERRKPEVMTVVTNLLDTAHRSLHTPRKPKVQRGDAVINSGYELKIIDASALPMSRDALTAFIENVLPISQRLLNQFASQWTIPASSTSPQIIILPAFIPIMAALRICCSFIPPQFDDLAPKSLNWIEARGKLAYWMYQQSSSHILNTLQKISDLKDSKIIFSMAKDPKFELKPIDLEIIFEGLSSDIINLLNMIQSSCYIKKATIESFWQGQEGIRFISPKVSKILNKLTNGAEPILINTQYQSSTYFKNDEPQNQLKISNQFNKCTSEEPIKSNHLNYLVQNLECDEFNKGIHNRLKPGSNEKQNLSNKQSQSFSNNKLPVQNFSNITKNLGLQNSVKSIVFNEKSINREGSQTHKEKCLNLFEEWLRSLSLTDKLLLQQELPYILFAHGNGLSLSDLIKWQPPRLHNDGYNLQHFPYEIPEFASGEFPKLTTIDWKVIIGVLKLLRNRGIDTLYSTSKNITFYLGSFFQESNKSLYTPYASPTPSTLPSPSNSRSPSESRSLTASASMSDLINPSDELLLNNETPDDHLWMMNNLKSFLNGIYPEQAIDEFELNISSKNKRLRSTTTTDIKDYILPHTEGLSQNIEKDSNNSKDTHKKIKQSIFKLQPSVIHSDVQEVNSLRVALNNHYQEKSKQKCIEEQFFHIYEASNNKDDLDSSTLVTTTFKHPNMSFSPFLTTNNRDDECSRNFYFDIYLDTVPKDFNLK